ncbi:MAG: hypothetical protein J0L79_01840 [Rickettsiales bacterium]|nr:hypothetical protein [Rickettsiales bacterium]MCA0254903.1 hypothetical protein [Pseudomonadota bacterium]
MDNELELIVDAIRHTSKLLLRDYFELEGLQSSAKTAQSFSEKSLIKAKEIFKSKIEKYFQVFFDYTQITNIAEQKKAIVVEFDGFDNLSKAMPFFSIVATLLVNKNGNLVAEKSVIKFPALGELYYASRGKGAWFERIIFNFSGSLRVRVSGTEKLEESVIGATKQNMFNPGSSSRQRIFGCDSYLLALAIAGKLDIAVMKLTPILQLFSELFASEAGGVQVNSNDSIFISNLKLSKLTTQQLNS